MGIYECILDCGDSNYCVSCSGSLDNFQSVELVLICEKHKLKTGQVWPEYSLENFISKYKKKNYTFPINKHYHVKVLDFTKYKDFYLVKLEVDNFEITGLDESKKIYFSNFLDEPAWSTSSNKTILIDVFRQTNIPRTKTCNNKNVYYDWEENKVKIREQSCHTS